LEIKILGPGCASCQKLEKVVAEAVKEIGGDITVEHINDMEAILSYGVLSLPSLVVDGKVRLSGKVPGKADIIKLLRS